MKDPNDCPECARSYGPHYRGKCEHGGRAKRSESSQDKRWNGVASNLLVGRTITAVRYMTHGEAREMGWMSRALIIQLDNGVQLIPQSDDEGNDAGALVVATPSTDEHSGLPTLP